MVFAKHKEKIVNSKLWQTRNPKLLTLFIIALSIGFVLLIVGIIFLVSANSTSYNSFSYYLSEIESIAKANSLPTEIKSKQVEFDVPQSYMDLTLPIKVNISFSSSSYFAQNTLFEINSTAIVDSAQDETRAINIDLIQLQPYNAIAVSPSEYTAAGYTPYSYYSSYPSTIYLYQQYSSTTDFQSLEGLGYCVFQNSGPVTINLIVSISRNYSMWNEIYSWLQARNLEFQNEYNINFTFSDLTVKSFSELTDQQRSDLLLIGNQRQTALQARLQALQTAMLVQNQAHQENIERMNLGLTFVIMFLATFVVSLIIYEQSNDDEREEQYYIKKRIEKYCDMVQ